MAAVSRRLLFREFASNSRGQCPLVEARTVV